MSRRLRLVDLFAGCGGFTEGFLDVNRVPRTPVEYEVVAAVEADRAAAASYAANFGRDRLYVGKVEDWLRACDIPRADVVIGGPPCQGFSYLGRRDPSDPRNVLWREYALALQCVQPSYFVIENVAAFFRSPQWEVLQEEVRGGLLQDYVLQSATFNAADFDVPQIRKRAVVIGRREGLPLVDLQPEMSGRGPTTVGEALQVLPDHVAEDDCELPSSRYEIDGFGLPGAFKTSQLHLTRTLTELSRRRIATIPPGGNRTDIPWDLLPDCWRKHKTGSMDVMGRLSNDRPSVTIRTEFVKPEKGRYLHPTQPRPLTHAEAALLQTFPLDFQWCGAKVAIAKQIGNAVPPQLARAIASAIASNFVDDDAPPGKIAGTFESTTPSRRC